MIIELGQNNSVNLFLFNPITGAQCQLSSCITTIPDSKLDLENKQMNAVRVVLSTSDVDSKHCLVAATFWSYSNNAWVLCLCRPRDESAL